MQKISTGQNRFAILNSTILFGLTLFGFTTASFASDWPTFGGPDRSSVSKETGLLKQWPEGGPPLVWKVEGTGRGYASVAIVGDKIFTLGDGLSTASDADEYLICLNRKDGKQVWATKTGEPWNSGQPTWQSSRSTPTVDGDRVYVLTPFGNLLCCDVEKGKEIWRKNMEKDFEGKKGDSWGYSESVTIDGDRLICTPGGETATMIALNKLTGEPVWKAVREKDEGAGHSSIVTSKIGGVKIYVQVTASGAMGVRASDGALQWTFPISKVPAAIPTPIVRDDLVFMSVGYKCGGALLRQKAGENNTVTMSEVYPLNTALANKHGGVVLVGDYVYADTEDSGIPFCAELMTGKQMWKKRASGKGSGAMTAADGCLYIHYADGTMVLAKASPDDYVEISTFKVPGSGDRPSWSHCVILDGKLYIREQDTLLCYDIREGGSAKGAAKGAAE